MQLKGSLTDIMNLDKKYYAFRVLLQRVTEFLQWIYIYFGGMNTVSNKYVTYKMRDMEIIQ